MNRILAFRPVVAILVVCAVVMMLVPVALSAAEPQTQPAAQMQKPVARQAVPVALSKAQLVDAKFTCGSTSVSNFRATVKNVSSSQAVFSGTLTMTLPGACLKTDSTKNPDGTPCTSDQMFCPGYCTQYAPDTTSSVALPPKTIAAGATAIFAVTVPNKMMKSSVVKVVEQGTSVGTSKKLGPFSVCIF